jgi:hypothetical protein
LSSSELADESVPLPADLPSLLSKSKIQLVGRVDGHCSTWGLIARADVYGVSLTEAARYLHSPCKRSIRDSESSETENTSLCEAVPEAVT